MEDGTISYDAVVLAGGAAARLGGADKPGLSMGGSTLLDRVLAACAGASATVVVGPRRPTARPVEWTRERPPGGGPLPALAAALHHVHHDVAVLLAADLPFVDAATVSGMPAALAADREAEGVVVVDTSGRDQPLLAAYRTEPLRRELALLAAEHGTLTGLPLRLLITGLVLRRTADPTGSAFDCDTWDDVTAARARLAGDPAAPDPAGIGEHRTVLDDWTAAVRAELGIDLDVDVRAVLDLARDAAHGVARPAAPLTTFLVGYAAAQAGGGPEAVAEALRKAQALAVRWAEDQQGEGRQPEGRPGEGRQPEDGEE